MKRSFGIVVEKVREARFFLNALSRSWDDQKSDFYFSAFASACRSITFTLQSVCARVPDFREWYAQRQAKLEREPLARFLLLARNQTQKVGLVPLAYRGSALERHTRHGHYCRRMYRFVALEQGTGTPPDGDAVVLCRRHLVNLAALVDECYSRFCTILDGQGELAEQVRHTVTIPAIKAPRCPLDRRRARRTTSLRTKRPETKKGVKNRKRVRG